MSELVKLLVPVDFSPCSRTALEVALAVAKRLGGSVHVLHVWKPPDSKLSRLVDVAEDAMGTAARELKTFIAEIAPHPPVDLQHRVEIGDPVERILAAGEIGKYDLIVVGTHGRTGRARLSVGSVAQTIVGSSPCPVLTVQERHQWSSHPRSVPT